MKKTIPAWLFLVAGGLFLVGCTYRHTNSTPAARGTEKSPVAQKAESPEDDEAAIKENLAKLSPEDRKLAEEQKYCAIENESRLGVMGVPFKVVLNDQPVFLCCKGCRKSAEKNPEKTLAKVQELKEKTAKESAKQ